MRHIIIAFALTFLPFIATAIDDIPKSPNVQIIRSTTSKDSDSNVFGHVLDAKTQEHIPYATVAIKGTTVGCAANSSGHYILNNLPVGEQEIVVSAIGYDNVELKINVKRETSYELNFVLDESQMMVDEVVVSATRNETNRRTTSTVLNVASTKLFESTASSNLSEAMNFQSGLRVENTCGNCGAPQLRINGLEGQYSQILLDSRAIFSSPRA